MSIDGDAARIILVETAEEVDDGGFAGAGGSGEGDCFACAGFEIDAVEGGLVFIVGEVDVFKGDVAFDGSGEWVAAGGVRFVFGVEDFEDAIGGRSGGEGHLVELMEFADGLVEEGQHEEELEELAEFHFSVDDRQATRSQNEDVANHAEEGHARRVKGPVAHQLEGGLLEAHGE